jgi:hypothetical protein
MFFHGLGDRACPCDVLPCAEFESAHFFPFRSIGVVGGVSPTGVTMSYVS